MRRTLCAILGGSLLGLAAWAADGPPRGTFEGQGVWRGLDGSTGQYQTRLTVTDDEIITVAEYDRQGTQHKERHALRMQATGPGFYDLLADGTKVGQLFCLEDQCTFTVNHDKVAVQEVWRLSGSELQKFGGKDIGAYKVVWKETLYAR